MTIADSPRCVRRPHDGAQVVRILDAVQHHVQAVLRRRLLQSRHIVSAAPNAITP